jgi:hypothetical protein
MNSNLEQDERKEYVSPLVLEYGAVIELTGT